jgi:hypothetical protein
VTADLTTESDLTRLVRVLLQRLKADVHENTVLTTSAEYDADAPDGVSVVAVAQLPALLVSGPTISPNRFYASNTGAERLVQTADGPELQRHAPTLTVDLAFTLSGVSARTMELLNMIGALGAFIHRTRWLELARDPQRPELGSVRYELDADAQFRPQLHQGDDVRSFTCGVTVRGFDLDEGEVRERSRSLDAAPTLEFSNEVP